jgi:hypothetical protein
MRHGGELSSCPLHFIWMADCSGSMDNFHSYQQIIKGEHKRKPR